jgi:hypothetical protein
MSRLSTNHISVNNILGKNYLPVADVFNFGVTGGDDYGATSSTNFYNGVVIPVGGYVIYLYQNSIITANAPKDDNECLYYLNRYGANATNIGDALTWAAAQPNITVQSSEYVVDDLLYTFTIQSSMLSGLANIGNSQYASANGTGGYTTSVQIDNLWFGVYGNLNTYSDIETAFTSIGAPMNYNGYIFKVQWGAGSTYSDGLAKLSYNSNSHQMTVTAVDSYDKNYLQQNTNQGSNLVGTFNFPATFTFVSPLITKQDWC